MIRIGPDLAQEIEALRGAAQVELVQLGENLGLDLAPPTADGLSDMALNVGREVDRMRVEIGELALCCGQPIARRRARVLVRELAEQLLAEMELASLGLGR